MSQTIDFTAKPRNYVLMTSILCWAGMAVMSSLYATIPLAPAFAKLFGVTLPQAAAAGSVFSLGFALGCLIYGALSDKYGRKNVIVWGLAALTLISLLLGMADHFAWILVLRCLQGLAAATFSPVALAYAVEMFPAEKRVTAIGFISTGFLTAGIVGQVVSSVISERYSWNAVFYLLAAVYAATSLLVAKGLPAGGILQANGSIWSPLKQIGQLFARKNLVLSYVVAAVLLMSFVSMYTALGSYLSGPGFQLSPQAIVYVRSAGVLGMLISPLAGRLARRFGVRPTLRGGLAVSMLSLAAMGVLSSLPLLIGLSIIFVAGIAITVPSLISLVGQLGGRARAIAVSVYTFILFMGTSLGPVLSLQLVKTGGYLIAFLLLSLILGIGMLAACLIDKDAHQDKAAQDSGPR